MQPVHCFRTFNCAPEVYLTIGDTTSRLVLNGLVPAKWTAIRKVTLYPFPSQERPCSVSSWLSQKRSCILNCPNTTEEQKRGETFSHSEQNDENIRICLVLFKKVSRGFKHTKKKLFIPFVLWCEQFFMTQWQKVQGMTLQAVVQLRVMAEGEATPPSTFIL